MLFITEYQVIGSRCSGTYLVNAESKVKANSIVKAFNSDYVRVRSSSKAEWIKVNGSDDWTIMVEGASIPVEGSASHLESGT